MKLELNVAETLIWHDSPQLFVAKDSIGGLYLCLLTDDSGEKPHYLVVAISSNRLQMLKSGKIDLHTVFAMPELNNWFFLSSIGEDDLFAEPFDAPEGLPAEMLPEPDVFLPRRSLLQPEVFEALKMSAVAKEAGMNPTLLRQYVTGVKHPSEEQAKRVEAALHRVAKRLLEVRLV